MDGGNPSGHSVVQRFEHWSAGLKAWLARPFIGHGMGDTPEAMADAYAQMGSQLSSNHRHRAHMQHLTWGISGGVLGLLLWLGFWPVGGSALDLNPPQPFGAALCSF